MDRTSKAPFAQGPIALFLLLVVKCSFTFGAAAAGGLTQEALSSHVAARHANCSLVMKGFEQETEYGVAFLKLHCNTSDGQPVQIGINPDWLDTSNTDLKGVLMPARPPPCVDSKLPMTSTTTTDYPQMVSPRKEPTDGSWGTSVLSFCSSRHSIMLQNPKVHAVWYPDDTLSDDRTRSSLLYFGNLTTIIIDNGSFRGNRGSLLAVTGGAAVIANSMIQGNAYGTAPLMLVYKARLLVVSGTKVAENVGRSNSSAFISGALAIYQCSKAVIQASTMVYNSYDEVDDTDYDNWGSAVQVTESDNVTITTCNFSHNTAPFGGALHVAGSSVSIHDTQFYDNAATVGGAMNVEYSTVDMSFVVASNNKANGGGVVHAGSSMLHVKHSSFSNNQVGVGQDHQTDNDGCSGGVFDVIEGSWLSMSNCSAHSNGAATGGVASAMGSYVTISNGVLVNNTATNSGGAVFADCQFPCDDDYIAQISYTKFVNNRATGSGGGAVSVGLIQANIANCAFLGNSVQPRNLRAAALGGAMSMEDNSYANVTSSLFSGNRAVSGGALSVVQYSQRFGGIAQLRMADCEVKNNTAASYGGGITVIGGLLSLKSSKVVSNIAGVGGGGARLETSYFVVADLQHPISGNRASFDSDWSVAVQHIRVEIASPNRPGLGTDVAADGAFRYLFNVTGFYGIPCEGTAVSIRIVTAGDTESHPRVYTNVSSADGGVHFSLHLAPGAYIAKASVVANSSISATVPFTIQQCPLGQIVGADGLCEACPIGTYSVQQNSHQCYPCPQGANCTGGAIMLPGGAYWRSSIWSDQFHRCPNPAACQGWQLSIQPALLACTREQMMQGLQAVCDKQDGRHEPATSYSDILCREGYHGNLCGQCDTGFGSLKPFVCRECMPRGAIIGLYISAAVVLLGLIKVLCHCTLSEASKSQHHAGVHDPQLAVQATALAKPLVLYFQYLLLVASLNIEWPAAFKIPLKAVSWVFSAGSPDTLSVDCLFPPDSYTIGITKTLFYIIAPLVLLVILLVGEFGVHLFHMRRRRSATAGVSIVDRLLSNAIVVVYFFLPSLLRTTLSLFACVKVDIAHASSSNTGLAAIGSYWLLDMGQSCFAGYHKDWALGLGFPLAVLICLGLPAATFILTLQNKITLRDPTFLRHYGFLYRNYRPACSYWEGVVALQTIALVAISVFGYSLGSYYQALLQTLALTLLWVVVATVKPYAHPTAQKLMEAGMLCVLLTSFASMSLLPAVQEQGAGIAPGLDLAIGIVLVLLNACFVGCACWQLWKLVQWRPLLTGIRTWCLRMFYMIAKR